MGLIRSMLSKLPAPLSPDFSFSLTTAVSLAFIGPPQYSGLIPPASSGTVHTVLSSSGGAHGATNCWIPVLDNLVVTAITRRTMTGTMLAILILSGARLPAIPWNQNIAK